VAKKPYFVIFCQKKFFLNLFQNDPVGVFLCEESFARIKKSSKRFLDHEIVKKNQNFSFFSNFKKKYRLWQALEKQRFTKNIENALIIQNHF